MNNQSIYLPTYLSIYLPSTCLPIYHLGSLISHLLSNVSDPSQFQIKYWYILSWGSCHSDVCTEKWDLFCDIQFSSVQLLSSVWLFATPWIPACQASLSITNSRSSLRLVVRRSKTPSQKPSDFSPLFGQNWIIWPLLTGKTSIYLMHACMLSHFSSVQFSHSVMSDSLWPHGTQHTRPPCLSPTPGVC